MLDICSLQSLRRMPISVVAMTSYTTSGHQERLISFTAISSILIASSPVKLQQRSGKTTIGYYYAVTPDSIIISHCCHRLSRSQQAKRENIHLRLNNCSLEGFIMGLLLPQDQQLHRGLVHSDH
jgi:hypothetical protein